MEKKTAVLLVIVVFGVALTMGCIDEAEETKTVSIDMNNTWSNQSQKEVSVVTEKSFGYEKTVIIGRLIEITFNYNNPDILVFQDGENKTVFCAKHAEDFIWEVGKIHKVTAEVGTLDGSLYIVDVKIANDTQTAHQAG
ncbi:hypothetical protein KAW43_00915 [Candidatus Parcubacteria bacterium]|nr:hypothetical protein [Candidatus Parcubacteria bacterium]